MNWNQNTILNLLGETVINVYCQAEEQIIPMKSSLWISLNIVTCKSGSGTNLHANYTPKL